MSERPNYQVYDPEMAKRETPREEKVDYVPFIPNPFMVDALMWEILRRERQLENEGGE